MIYNSQLQNQCCFFFPQKEHPLTTRQYRSMKNAWTQFCESSWRGRGLACMPGSIPALTDQSSEALTNQDASLTTQQNRYDCVNTICVYKSYNGLTSNIKKKRPARFRIIFSFHIFYNICLFEIEKKNTKYFLHF